MTRPQCLIPGTLAWLVLATGCGRAPAPDATSSRTITVFAAASTTDVIDAAAARFEASHGVKVECSFGASSTLARQIRAGAPADVFLSADEVWMDELENADLIVPGSRGDLLANRLVLIVPAGSTLPIESSRGFDLAGSRPDIRRVAIADPAHVPAGRYARQALRSLGWWDRLDDRVVPALDARAALRLVELGEADLGVVYATDAHVSDRVETRGEIPADTHDPIRYPVAQCRGASPFAAAFIDHLRSDAAATIFREAGFATVSAGGHE